jgi:hypothetical protein
MNDDNTTNEEQETKKVNLADLIEPIPQAMSVRYKRRPKMATSITTKKKKRK